MVLLLRDSDVVAAIDSQDAVRRSVEALEGSFAAFERKETSPPTMGYAVYPPDAETYEEVHKSLNVPLGIIPSMNAMALGIVPIHQDHVTRPHSLWQLLVDYETFELRCLMEDHTLHEYMVGAQFGVAARYLAADDASVVAIVGAGKMGRACLRAIAAVRDIDEVRVFSPSPDSRKAFVDAMTGELGLKVIARDSAREAVDGASIVQCATNAEVRGFTKVVEADWIAPGALVSTMSRNELDRAMAMRARVVPSAASQIPVVRPEWKPWKELFESGELPNQGPDLTTIVAGNAPRRDNDEDVNVYLGSNLGSHRVAMARWIFDEANRAGVGTTWALD